MLRASKILLITGLFAVASSTGFAADTPLYLSSSASNALFSSATTNVIAASSPQAPKAQNVISANYSFDFYSAPLTASQSLALLDGICNSDKIGFTNAATTVAGISSLTVTAYDYDPATGNSTSVASTSTTGNTGINGGSAAQVTVPAGGTLLLGYTFAKGHMVRISIAVTVTGASPNSVALLYGGASGASATSISFPHGQSISWPFGAYVPVPPFTTSTNVGPPLTLTITGYTGPGGSVTIPSNIFNVTVTEIGSNAFASNSTITNITIPATVTNIAAGAFADCPNLTAVYFESNPPQTSLTAFLLDPVVTVYHTLVSTNWGSTLGGVTTALVSTISTLTNLDGTLTILGGTGLTGALDLSTNINGQTVTAIADNAFSGNTNITSVILGSSITNIGTNAFAGCVNLTNVLFDGSAPTIGLNAFVGDVDAIAYYAAGATGFGTVIGGLPVFSTALSVTLASPANNASFVTPASVQLTANVATALSNTSVSFYNGGNLMGTLTAPPYTMTVSNLSPGGYSFMVTATNAQFGISSVSPAAYITVNNIGSSLIDFDALDTTGGQTASGAALSNYLAQYGVTILSQSSNTTVTVENQANVAGGNVVLASSAPNILTQAGSSGPVDFALGFNSLLSQFSFTRPQLLANPLVVHPAWQAKAYDSLGILLETVQEPQISSTTNVPAQAYTLSGGSIASVEFDSMGTGLTTVNGMLIDDLLLTPGAASNLPPSILISQPVSGQVLTSSIVPLQVETAAGSGSVATVAYYCNGVFYTNFNGPYSTVFDAPSNGGYTFSAVVYNYAGLSSTSAPVSVNVATGFAILNPPVSQTVSLGNAVTFDVTTTVSNATYQWLLNGQVIPLATKATYTVTNALAGAIGNYTVEATAAGQTLVSAPAVLTVVTPPTVGTIIAVTNGADITLSLLVSNGAPFYALWELNGTAIPGASNSFAPGVSQFSYTISNAQPFESGDYAVVTANAVSSAVSPEFDLTIGAASVPVATNINLSTSLALPALTNGVAVWASNGSSSLPAVDGPALIAGKPAGGFIWYNWNADFTGTISLTTRGSTFDTLLGVYTLDNNSNLDSVVEDDDSGGYFTSLVTFDCVQGVTYYIAIAGYRGATGNAALEVAPGAGSGLLGPASGILTAGFAPRITRQPTNQLVALGGTLSLNVGASGATSYQWYCNQDPVANGNSSALVISNFPISALGNYYVVVSNAIGSVQSESATVQVAEENHNATPHIVATDKFGDAVDLTSAATTSRFRPKDSGGDSGGFTLSQSFSTVGATKESNEPNHAGQPGGASYWYTYTPTAGGTVQFDTSGSSFNTILAVYTGPGTSFSTLVNVAAGYTTNFVQQGQPVVLVSNVVAGTTFYIAIDGYLGASGSAVLNVTLNPTNTSTNITVNTNIPPLTNTYAVLNITSPSKNSVTTSDTVNILGTLRSGNGHPLPQTAVEISVNGNTPVSANLGPAGSTVSWSLPDVPLLPGANTIVAQATTVELDGTINVSQPLTRSVFNVPALPSRNIKTPITLQTTGSGRISGMANGQLLEVNGVYTVTALPAANFVFSNWTVGTDATNLAPLSTTPNVAFLMSSNLILCANFVTNPFGAVAGSYTGLFFPATGVTESSSGLLAANVLNSPRGAFTAKLSLDGDVLPFSGTFDLTGDAGMSISRHGKAPLIVELHLNLAKPDNQLTGTIFEWASGGWISQLQADRAVFDARSNPASQFARRFTFVIPPGSNSGTQPGGYGYGTLTNTLSGDSLISGQLGDGSSFSQTAPVSAQGYIPLYVPLYSHKGILMDWLLLTNSLDGTSAETVTGAGLAWIKEAAAKGALYSAGFTNTNLSVYGSMYTPPSMAGSSGATNETVIFYSQELPGPVTNSDVTLTSDKLVGNDEGGGALSGTISPATGIVTLKIHSNNRETIAKGVLVEGLSATNAAGWFPGTNKSGYFFIQP